MGERDENVNVRSKIQSDSNQGVSSGNNQGVNNALAAIYAGSGNQGAIDFSIASQYTSEAQQSAILEVFSAITADLASAGLPVTQILPITVFMESGTQAEVEAVAEAVQSLVTEFHFDVFFKESGEWGSWFGRFFARSRQALTSEQLKDTMTRAERALEMQALLLPQAQIDATQAGAAANLIAALSSTPNAIVQIGSVLLIKVDGTPIVRNLTQIELSYLEHNKHLYRSPKDALEELARVSDDPHRFTPLVGQSQAGDQDPTFETRHPDR